MTYSRFELTSDDLIEVRSIYILIKRQKFKSVLSLVEDNINKALEYNVVYLQGPVPARLTFILMSLDVSNKSSFSQRALLIITP